MIMIMLRTRDRRDGLTSAPLSGMMQGVGYGWAR
ncbi:UNVERIFIED_ORG: cyanate permease [Arthrobacter sp. UYCu721]